MLLTRRGRPRELGCRVGVVDNPSLLTRCAVVIEESSSQSLRWIPPGRLYTTDFYTTDFLSLSLNAFFLTYWGFMDMNTTATRLFLRDKR